MNQDKEKMLKITTDQIESKFGRGSIMKLGEGGADLAIGVIPTGALPLDAALGIGGVPRGRIVEIYGPESSGKTTLALQIIAQAQAMGGIVAFIDAESTPSILFMPPASGSILTRSSFRSPIQGEQKHSKYATCSFARARLIASSWTLSPLWFPVLRSKGRWGIQPWAAGSPHVPGFAKTCRFAF